MTAWGFLPDLSEYDSQQMADLHFVAMQSIDGRVSTHEEVRDTGRQLASLLGDQAAGLCARRLRGSPMSALDDVVLAEAGNARYDTIPQIEKAVDDGYPVPISTQGGGEGHQMMIIGHAGNQLEIYNPWGYTYWVSEDSFSGGDIAEGTPGLPGTPVSVRLPQGVK